MSHFAKALAQVRKDQPTVSDVHVASTRFSDNLKHKRKKALVDKSQKPDFLLEVTVEKADEPQRLVFGWASIIEKDGQAVEDSQGDIINETDLEKAFYDFTESGGLADYMHDWADDGGKCVEAMVFTKEKQKALGIDLKKVGAWVGFRLRDDIFKSVMAGDRCFSIGGTGERVAL